MAQRFHHADYEMKPYPVNSRDMDVPQAAEPTLYDKLQTVVRQLDEARMERASAQNSAMEVSTYLKNCEIRVDELIHEYDELVVRVRDI